MNLKFTSVQDVTTFFAQWYDLSESDRLKVLRGLKDLGHLGPLSTKQIVNDTTCPKYGFSLIRPCGLNTCQYHVNSPEAKNCLHYSLSQAKKNRLTATEVSTLTNLSQSDINTILNQTIVKIRRQLLKERLERTGVPIFFYLSGHCLGCEVSIMDDLEAGMRPDLLYDSQGKFGWCSDECKKIKPAWMFKLEHVYHSNFLDVLAIAVLTLTVINRDIADTKEAIYELANLLEIEVANIMPHWDNITKRIGYFR